MKYYRVSVLRKDVDINYFDSLYHPLRISEGKSGNSYLLSMNEDDMLILNLTFKVEATKLHWPAEIYYLKTIIGIGPMPRPSPWLGESYETLYSFPACQ